MFKRTFYIMVLFINFCFAQSKTKVEQIMQLSELYYKEHPIYYYQTVYKFFKDTQSTIALDQDYGQLIGRKNIMYQKMYEQENLSFEGKILTIDRKQKIVSLVKNNGTTNFFGFYNYLNQYQKKVIIKNDNYFICELYEPKSEFIQYYKIRLYFNKADYSLYKQSLYTHGNRTMIVKGEKIYIKNPRLEVIFRKGVYTKEHERLLKPDNYYSVNSKGKIILKNNIANYKLITN